MRSETETDRLEAARQRLEALGGATPEVVLVLGSGLHAIAERLEDPRSLSFAEIAHWPVPRVAGHGSRLVIGAVGGTRVACLTGRVHRYEGWHPHDVVRPVRTLCAAGVRNFVLTNAAGGLAGDLRPGDLMLLSDHLNLTGTSPLVGAHEPALGPRFPDQSRVYDPALRARLLAAAPGLREGVYAGVTGPQYETPAEVRMLALLGADAVGMSTVHEAIALHAMGARVAGISLISNLAAGRVASGSRGGEARPLRHEDVLVAGKAAAERLTGLLLGLCEELAP